MAFHTSIHYVTLVAHDKHYVTLLLESRGSFCCVAQEHRKGDMSQDRDKLQLRYHLESLSSRKLEGRRMPIL